MYYVYIVQCADKTLYTGICTNILRRIKEHNSGKKGAKYTRTRQPVTLVYTSTVYTNRSDATKEELRIKKMSRAEKMKLINNTT